MKDKNETKNLRVKLHGKKQSGGRRRGKKKKIQGESFLDSRGGAKPPPSTSHFPLSLRLLAGRARAPKKKKKWERGIGFFKTQRKIIFDQTQGLSHGRRKGGGGPGAFGEGGGAVLWGGKKKKKKRTPRPNGQRGCRKKLGKLGGG